MDYAALKDYILADTELAALAAAGADESIAQAINARSVPVYASTEIGNGLILATIGLIVGNALLDMINAAPDFRHVKPLLEQGRLDISSPLARGALDSLVGVVDGFTQGHADAIKALAQRQEPVFGRLLTDDDVWKARA